MNNKDLFLEKMNESGDTKYEMSEIHSRIIGRIKSLYGLVFNREKKDFLTLKNMIFFKSGVPEPESRSRLHDMLDNFIHLANHYDFLGEDEIVEYLKEAGIEISFTKKLVEDGPVQIIKEEQKNFDKAWEFSMGGEPVPATKKEFLNVILDKALVEQKTVMDKKGKIDVNAEDVQNECMIKKPHFMKAINIKFKELKKRSIDNDIEDAEKDIVSAQEVVTFLKENLDVQPSA